MQGGTRIFQITDLCGLVTFDVPQLINESFSDLSSLDLVLKLDVSLDAAGHQGVVL